MKIMLSADSTCDLPQELVEARNIQILPLYINSKEKSYRDGVDITPDDIFRHVESGGPMYTTAAVPVADYVEAFTRMRSQCDAVIHLNISAQMSASHQNARIAATEVGGVYPFDAKNLSTGIGLLVLLAADWIAAGKGPEDILAALADAAGHVEASFVIDTLRYLHKGGRCSAVAALGANLLRLKPCIEVKDGAMSVGKKYRGNIADCFLEYCKDRLDGRSDLGGRVFITHSGVAPQTLGQVRRLVEQTGAFSQILESRAGCTISNHCGPNTLGVLFVRQ